MVSRAIPSSLPHIIARWRAWRRHRAGILLNVLVKFQNNRRVPGSRAAHAGRLPEIIDKKIEPEFGDLPIAALSELSVCRGVFKDWRDRLALKSRRQADYAWAVLARVLPWRSIAGGLTPIHASGEGALYGNRSDKIWTLDDELAFLEKAPPIYTCR